MCQRQSLAIKLLGFSSAFLRIAQVSQAKVFSEGAVFCVFIGFLSLPCRRGAYYSVAAACYCSLKVFGNNGLPILSILLLVTV